MKKTLFFILAMMCYAASWAFGFSAVASSGQTLYYNFLGGNKVLVTFPNSSSENYSGFSEPTGNLIIPSTVTHSGNTYSVSSINSYAFRGCSGLTSVSIPNSVTTIGRSAFNGCSGLTSITIPNSVTTIDEHAFYGCSGLISVAIGNSVTSIGDYAFDSCINVSTLIYNARNCTGNSFSTSPYNGFQAMTNLTTLIIGDSVQVIPDSSFYNRTRLTSVTIGNAVTSIGNSAFGYCSNLTSVTIPNSVTSIGNSAFLGCTGLSGITIGNAVTSIGDWAFSFCRSLSSVNISNSVTSIGNSAFYECAGLTSVTIPNSVTSIGSYTFAWCRGLTSVAVPNSVTSIGDSAFFLVRNIAYHGIAMGSPWGALCHNGYVEYPLVFSNSTKSSLLGCATDAISVTIPNTVTSIGPGAFRDCRDLNGVTIPNSVTSIGDLAFAVCRGLTSVAIGNSVTTIGGYAFYFCDSLTSLTIGNSVATIGNSAFEYCRNLTSITIPNSVTTIGRTAFDGCERLNSLTIGNSVTSIGSYAFSSCRELTSVTIPNSITTIGSSCFSYCTGLTSITIPNSVTSIGNDAFFNCTNIDTIICKANVAPSVQSGSFSNVPNATTVIIPCGSLSSYQSRWSRFSNFVTDQLYSISVASEDETMGTVSLVSEASCSAPAVVQATPNCGYDFVRWSDGSTDNPYSFTLTCDTSLTAYFAETVPDTVIVYDTTILHDTIFVHDTTVVLDTVSHRLTVAADDPALGTTIGSARFVNNADIQIYAIAKSAAAPFLHWNDGDTTNPRIVSVNSDTTFTAVFTPEVPDVPADPCTITTFPYFENFDTYTTSTTAKTMVQPPCWTLVHQDVAMTDAYKPMIYYASNRAHSSSYSLILNKRGYYAMPAIDANMSDVRLTMYLCQNQTKYQLEVGVLTDPNDYTSFVRVARINNTVTTPKLVSVDFSSYSGPGRTICFHNVLASGTSGDYSCNYIDDLTLTLAAPAPEPVSYTLTAVANNATMGSVMGSGTYLEGSSVTLTATANSGYQFDCWSDGTNINPRIVTVTGNATYTAIFSERTSEPTDPCTIATFPYFENFDTYTTSTTAKTMVQPPCWKLVHQDVSMTDAYKPMIYYASARAHSSNYSLILNKRGYYAMPAVDVDVRNIRLSMYLCQQMTKYQLQVGVLTDTNDYTTFTRVATINNSATTPVQVTVDFSSYTGTGRYICFRNTLQSGVTGDYSCNYIDDLTLTLATTSALSESDAITAEPVSEAAVEEMAQEDDILSMIPTEDHGELTVYPNPTSGMVTLDADEIESTEVYDNTGRRVATYTDQRTLDLSNLPTGMYTLRITLPDMVEIRRVVKK